MIVFTVVGDVSVMVVASDAVVNAESKIFIDRYYGRTHDIT